MTFMPKGFIATKGDSGANRCNPNVDPEEQKVSPSEVVQRPKVTYSDISGLYHVSHSRSLSSYQNIKSDL